MSRGMQIRRECARDIKVIAVSATESCPPRQQQFALVIACECDLFRDPLSRCGWVSVLMMRIRNIILKFL